MEGSPVDLLLAYLQNPSNPVWSEFAHAAALHLIAHNASRKDKQMVGTLMGQITMTANMSGKTLRAKELQLSTEGPEDLPEEVWNTFLTLANLMWLAPDDALTVSTNKTTAAVQPAPTAPQTIVDKLAPVATGWQDAFEEFAGEEDVENALRVLADVGATPADLLGEELESVPTVLIWPAQKIVLLFDTDADDTLREQGWTPLHADSLTADDVPTALLHS